MRDTHCTRVRVHIGNVYMNTVDCINHMKTLFNNTLNMLQNIGLCLFEDIQNRLKSGLRLVT